MILSNYTKEFSTNLKIAYPVMLGQLGHVLVALADNLMVGQLGAAELAAVSLGNSLIFIALSLGIGFSFAITPLIAEADGANDIDAGRDYFQHGVIMCTLNGILLFFLLLLAKPILYALNQPPEVVALAIPYMEIVAFSLIPLMTFQAFKQFADGLSQTKYAMYATLVSNIVNIIFNYLLIYGFWIFPRLELEGAAIGTLISRFFMLWFLWFILKRKTKFAQYFTTFKRDHLNKNVFKRLFALGFPTALQMFFEVAIFTATIFLAGILGTNPQAANQIALNLSSMTFMIAVGLGVTATIRVGNQKGMHNYKELRRIALSTFLLIFIIQSIFALMFILTKDILPTFYLDNVEVIVLASQLLIVSAIFQLSDGIQVVVLGALRGLQDVKVPTIICFIAYWIIGFPISYYFGKAEQLGSMGIWLGLLAGLTASAIMLYIRFNYLSKKLILTKTKIPNFETH
ncbi:MATE family efflux transporter [Croceibacter atlanticus]|uniref:Multidrug-efflux transporter n=1 Tax=Croceibacter atlanticus (strain ATCC BAA-628 / JCM 21780 / CIP 108009 / IAM 15332 / KCTC 12090 / HTCC2559) TaxID=216432 RepID=A3U8Q7_CROAH|nr:MATE family efflux transporter [Croceibacter atlanticus]MAM22241.1 MATE family efflux transporter [Croceibacter sp.]HAT69962.1 MATE family efflux transporter [Flavobacteriaceae bacterium]EAP86193.2 MATE efflux family protein [Croceibacter atlanticus HTCC2559]MBW4968946.1 MATE family efflux transporter [Croceibacter atlanticus]WSP33867.1 MATE family efflux transporter [Croceibacter atlanticus]